jgi:WD40 repeat protein
LGRLILDVAIIATLVANGISCATAEEAPKPLAVVKTPGGLPRALAFSRDGKLLAAFEHVVPPVEKAKNRRGQKEVQGGGGSDSGGADGNVRYYGVHPQDRVVAWEWQKKSSKPRAFAAMLPAETAVKIPDIKDIEKPVHTFAPGFALSFEDDDTVVGSLWEGQVRKWSLKNGKVLKTFPAFAGDPRAPVFIPAIQFSPDNKLLAVTNWGRGALLVLNPATGETIGSYADAGPAPAMIAFAPDSSRIAFLTSDCISVLKPNGDEILDLGDSSGSFKAIAFLTKDEVRVFDDTKFGTLRDWDLVTGKMKTEANKPAVFTPKAGKAPHVFESIFSPDGSKLLIVRAERPFVLCEAAHGESLARFDEVKQGPADAVFSPNGEFIATTNGEDNTVKIWKVADLKMPAK